MGELRMSEILDKQIGVKLKKLREQRNLSQRSAAEKIDVAHSYISRIENGIIPSLDTLNRFCEVYGVSISSLFEGEVSTELKALDIKWIECVTELEQQNISPDEVIQLINGIKTLKKLYKKL